MRRFSSHYIPSFVIALGITLLGVPTASIASPLSQTEGRSFTLEQLRVPEPIPLNGPLTTQFINFRFPADWELTGGSALQLTFDTAVPGFQELEVTSPGTNTSRTSGVPVTPARFGGNLRVVMNNVPLAVVPLNRNGTRSLSIPIPIRALSATQANGLHYLAFQLDDKSQCGKNDQTFLTIDPQTTFVVPNRAVPIAKDLTQLPRPFYQRSFVPDEAVLVVPDAPTALELQAALNVAAGFGRMTGGGLVITLTTVSQLTQDLRDRAHLILVGKPAGLPLLKDLKLPLALSANSFENAQPNNGVLQLTDSPWNAARAVLLVSGETDEGVATAAQALSTGTVRASKFTNFALVLGGQSEAAPLANLIPAADISLQDLGYEDKLLQGGGTQSARYVFSLPEDQVAAKDSYVEVSYVHSAVLDYARSNLSVLLNGASVGSVRLDDNSTRLSRARIYLPANTLRAGENQLEFRSTAVHRDDCVLDGSGLWMNIHAESRLHILTRANDSDPGARKVNLSGYLNSLTSQSDLSNIAFVLGANDKGGWDAAARLAFGLGAQFDPSTTEPTAQRPLSMVAAYSDALPNAIRDQREVIAVGKASTLVGVMDELNKVLPAPFPQGGDIAIERDASLQYRAPSDADIGYLQLLLSPWNARRNVFAVLGSTDAGLRSASTALFDPQTRSQVSGNLVFVNGQQIVAVNNQRTLVRAIAATTSAPAANPTVAFQSPQSPSTAPTASPLQPTSILSIVAVTIGGLLLVGAVIAVTLVGRRNRTRVLDKHDLEQVAQADTTDEAAEN